MTLEEIMKKLEDMEQRLCSIECKLSTLPSVTKNIRDNRSAYVGPIMCARCGSAYFNNGTEYMPTCFCHLNKE